MTTSLESSAVMVNLVVRPEEVFAQRVDQIRSGPSSLAPVSVLQRARRASLAQRPILRAAPQVPKQARSTQAHEVLLA